MRTMDRQYEKRKKMVYQFICDEFYVPMKMKEMAAILPGEKDDRQDLKEILDALGRRKIHRTQKAIISRAGQPAGRNLSGSCKGIWLCLHRRIRR